MVRQPNLLFIFTDQQRADTIECYGNNRIQAPHINGLARESFVFQNAYVSAPLCTPSRSTILTGLYPHTHGAVANNMPLGLEHRTIAEMVSEHYTCAYYGKWHLGDEVVPQRGFQGWLSIEDYYRQYYTRSEYLSLFSDYHHYLVRNGYEPDAESEDARVFSRPFAAKVPEQHTKAAFLGREAARFIREVGDQPFILYVNFLEPHQPYDGPLNDMYRRDELGVGPHFLRRPSENTSRRHKIRADYYRSGVHQDHDLSTENGWRELRANYCGNVTLMDRAVGTILRALDEADLAGSTIVAFTSEHGDMLGDHGILQKSVLYEEAIKVPLLLCVPWLDGGGRMVMGRVGQVDLVPTLLDLMGEPVPPHLQGESRVPVLRGDTSLDGNDVFVQWNEPPGRDHAGHNMTVPDEELAELDGMPWRTIISADGWKLSVSAEDQCELYDLNTDPYEESNLFDVPAHKRRIRELSCRLRSWQKRTRDTAPLPNFASDRPPLQAGSTKTGTSGTTSPWLPS